MTYYQTYQIMHHASGIYSRNITFIQYMKINPHTMLLEKKTKPK